MQPVVMEYQYENTDEPRTIKITWTAPYANSETITGYEIKIYGYPGTLTNTFTAREYFTTSECDGLTDPVFT